MRVLWLVWRFFRAIAMELAGYCYVHGTVNTLMINGRFGPMSCNRCNMEDRY